MSTTSQYKKGTRQIDSNVDDDELDSDGHSEKTSNKLRKSVNVTHFPEAAFKGNVASDEDDISTDNLKMKKDANDKLSDAADAYCEGCNKTLHSKNELKMHFHNHIKVKKKKLQLECDVCNEVFAKITNLHDHFSEQHIVSNSYLQDEVTLSNDEEDEESSYDSDTDQKLPVAKHISDLCHQCRVCESIFSAHDELKSHLMQEHVQKIQILKENSLFKCKVCEITFTDNQILGKHLIKHAASVPYSWTINGSLAHKGVFYICHQCGKRFRNLVSLRRHRKVHYVEDTGPCSCKDCHKKFNNVHKFFVHKDSNRCSTELIQCDICGNILSNKSSLRDHMRLHNGLMPFQCKTCETFFSSRTKLKYHFKVNHVLPAGEKLRHCPYCTKTFIKDEELSEHMKLHSNTVLTCKHCGTTDLSSRDALRRHQNKHTQLYYRFCHICGKGFSNTNQLNRHIRKHTGEKPFQCPQCEKSFSQNENLKTHMRQHSGEKPFMCEHCAQSFTNKCSLVRHMEKHKLELKHEIS